MLKTLAAKHQSSVKKMAARHRAKVQTPLGLRTCYEARIERDGKPPLVARFGGIPLKRDRNADSGCNATPITPLSSRPSR